MEKILEELITGVKAANRTYYNGKLTDIEVRKYLYKTRKIGALWVRSYSYAWSPLHDDSTPHLSMTKVGPATTSRLLYVHSDDKNMLCLTWCAAAIQTITSNNSNRDWYGKSFKIMEDIKILLLEKYNSRFQYPHACKSAFPTEIPSEIYKPIHTAYELGAIAANMAFITLSTHCIAVTEFC